MLPVLFVLGGAEALDERALFAIDRYIQGGGKVLFALEAVEVDAQYNLSARPVNDQGLLAMVASYGVIVRPELVMEAVAALPPPYSLTRYPYWVTVMRENGNPLHPISAAFAGLDLFWANPLELKPPAGVEGNILFTSTPEAWLATGDFAIDPNMDYLFSREEAATKGVKILAAALTGKFPSWEKTEPPGPDAASRDSRIVVIGDTDLAYSPHVQYARSQRNLDFLIQAADWLSNDDDIIGIRNRQSPAGRLDRIANLERRAAAMAFARVFNMAILPLAVIAAGALMALRRRRLLREYPIKGRSSDGL
jgi:ABC-type uncharacterized transport system involved in gliding motility auxiliary subunit